MHGRGGPAGPQEGQAAAAQGLLHQQPRRPLCLRPEAAAPLPLPKRLRALLAGTDCAVESSVTARVCTLAQPRPCRRHRGHHSASRASGGDATTPHSAPDRPGSGPPLPAVLRKDTIHGEGVRQLGPKGGSWVASPPSPEPHRWLESSPLAFPEPPPAQLRPCRPTQVCHAGGLSETVAEPQPDTESCRGGASWALLPSPMPS